MQNAEFWYPLRGWISIVPDHTFILHFTFCILHCPVWGGHKNNPIPWRNRGGIQKYSTVPPWLRRSAPPLIDALTGAPGGAFLPHGSEVVSHPAGVQPPCTKVAASLGILPGGRVFITAFYSKKFSTDPPKCQSPRDYGSEKFRDAAVFSGDITPEKGGWQSVT